MFNITLHHQDDEWLATIDGKDSSYFGTGSTCDEAIGDLITAFQATLGIRITNLSGQAVSPLDGMAAENALEPSTPPEHDMQVAAANAQCRFEVS